MHWWKCWKELHIFPPKVQTHINERPTKKEDLQTEVDIDKSSTSNEKLYHIQEEERYRLPIFVSQKAIVKTNYRFGLTTCGKADDGRRKRIWISSESTWSNYKGKRSVLPISKPITHIQSFRAPLSSGRQPWGSSSRASWRKRCFYIPIHTFMYNTSMSNPHTNFVELRSEKLEAVDQQHLLWDLLHSK